MAKARSEQGRGGPEANEASTGGMPHADGRRARSERTRAAVAEAMLDCLESGILQPSAKQVAERAGISPRGVFRHFDSMEKLFEAVAALQFERVVRQLPPLCTEGRLAERLDALIERSARRNEHIAPVRRAALLMEPFSEVVQRGHAWLRRSVAEEVRQSLDEELSRIDEAWLEAALESLRVLFSFSHHEELRRHGSLSQAAAARAVRMQALGLLLALGAIDAGQAQSALARDPG